MKKPTLPRGNAPQSATTRYSRFVGVDFASEPTTMESIRSPMAPNLVAGDGGYPEKRFGFIELSSAAPDIPTEDKESGVYDRLDRIWYSALTGATEAFPELWGSHAREMALAITWNAYVFNGIRSIHRAVLDGVNYFLIQRGAEMYLFDYETGTETLLGDICENNAGDFSTDLMTAMNNFQNLIATYTSNGEVDWLGINHTGFDLVKNDFRDLTDDLKKEYDKIQPATSVALSGKLWLLAGDGYYYYDGTDYEEVSEIAYVPTVVISAEPATAGGVAHEPYNLLQPQYTISYVGDGATTVYKTIDKFDDSLPYVVKVNDVILTSGVAMDGDSGTVTFTVAPSKPAVVGQDNVEITVTRKDYTDDDVISKCTVMGLFGLGGADTDRIFFTGNPEKPNVDWHCDISAPDYNVDPTYIPDTSFAYVGAEQSAIMGYRRIGAYQVIVKEGNSQDASIYLRSAALDIDGETAFGIQQGAAGIGAIAKRTFANLGDDPLFLSRDGIMGISSIDVTALASVENRSYFVNPLLVKEPDLDKAVAVEWKGMYILCVNNRCYVLDGSQFKQLDPRSGSNAIYECYFWTDIPAECFCATDHGLMFGARDGTLYMFDPKDRAKEYTDNDFAIDAWWSSKPDDDGDFSIYKSTVRSGCYIMTRPNTEGTLDIYTITQRNTDIDDDEYYLQKYTPDKVGFKRKPVVQAFPAARKSKKYITLQFIVRNNVAGEDFGMAALAKKYIYGGKVKGSARIKPVDNDNNNGGGDDNNGGVTET